MAPLFTFYPCLPDGSSSTFEMFEETDDTHALVRAQQVLREHSSATEVIVWQGERRVGIISGVCDAA